MSEPRLFDPGPAAEPPPELSADRKRTLRNEATLAGGWHPVAKVPLAGNGETCGTCANAFHRGGVAGNYIKCRLNNTGGAATDIRLKWPACEKWEA